jgi:hypothetical protein
MENIDIIENNSVTQVFDMIVDRLSNIEESLVNIKDYLIWKERHQSFQKYKINGSIFGFPFDIGIEKDENELAVYSSKSYMVKIDISYKIFKDYLLEKHRKKLSEFSRKLLTEEQYREFWETIDTWEYMEFKATITCEDLGLKGILYKYADDYIISAYMRNKCNVNFEVRYMGFLKDLYFITRTSTSLFPDEIIKETVGLLAALDFRQTEIHIDSITIYPLNEKYENLSDIIFFPSTTNYSEFKNRLFNELSTMNYCDYFNNKRFKGLVDECELYNYQINRII